MQYKYVYYTSNQGGPKAHSLLHINIPYMTMIWSNKLTIQPQTNSIPNQFSIYSYASRAIIN